jgi:hypothetical protein
VVTAENVNHQIRSPDEGSIAPAPQASGAAPNTPMPVAASTSAYLPPGVKDSLASYPVSGSRRTATFSPSGR